MTESVLEGGKRFHFDTSRFFDDSKPEQLDEGTQQLVSEINGRPPTTNCASPRRP